MSSMIPQLNSCCCGLSLETGAKIIGWFELVTSYIGTLFYWIALDAVKRTRASGAHTPEDLETDALVGFVVSFFNVFLASSLLLGISQRKPSLVKLWLICKFFTLILMIAILFPVLVLDFGLAPIVILNLLMLRTYCVLIVNSFFNEINWMYYVWFEQ